MTSKEDIEHNKISELKNYIPIITDDKIIIEYFKLTKQYRYFKKQHTLKIKIFKKHYKKDVLQLKNKYRMYYNIANKEYNTSVTSIQSKLNLINYNNVFYKQLTTYINMLLNKYDHNIVFRAFYFSFLFDIYIMVQNDKYAMNLNKISEKEQKQFIDRTIQHLLQFYNGFIPKKEYKFYSLKFTTKHYNEDPDFEDVSFNDYKNNPEFAIFYNICYNLYFIRREIVFDYVNLDEIFEKCYKEIKQFFNKKYFKNNFWIIYLRENCEKYIKEIQLKYKNNFNYRSSFEKIDLIYIFGDVLYQPPKDGYYGFDNDYRLTNYFEDFLKQIPYSDFYFRNSRYYFDNEYNHSNIEDDESEDDESEEDDE